MDTEKKCVANFLVTTVLLQNIEVAFLHMAWVPHPPARKRSQPQRIAAGLWQYVFGLIIS